MFDKEKHQRRSIRLKGWDYSNAGAYFVTICSYRKECIFENDSIKQIIVDEWFGIPNRFQNARIDEFIAMPNHIHGVIWIDPVGAGLALPNNGLALPNNKSNTKRGGPMPTPTLGDIICAFKSQVVVNINRYRNTIRHPVWQRNYYEHIIRNEDELNRIRRYIIENPLKWDEDPENPKNINKKLEAIWR
jgi:REP element-mobilizing transposase RayT